MALFSERPTEKLFGGDTATRALSSTAVENAFVERVYEKLAGVYDLTFGPTLHPGRLQALDRMAIARRQVGARSRRRHRHQPRALPARLPDHRHRPVGGDAREGA